METSNGHTPETSIKNEEKEARVEVSSQDLHARLQSLQKLMQDLHHEMQTLSSLIQTEHFVQDAQTAPHAAQSAPLDGALSSERTAAQTAPQIAQTALQVHRKSAVRAQTAQNRTASHTRAQAVTLSTISKSKDLELAGNACTHAHESSSITETQDSNIEEPRAKVQYFRALWRKAYQQLYPHRRRAPYIRCIDDLGIEELSREEIDERLRRFFEDPEAQSQGHPVGWLVAGWDMDYATPSSPQTKLIRSTHIADEPPCTKSASNQRLPTPRAAVPVKDAAWHTPPPWAAKLQSMIPTEVYYALSNGARADHRDLHTLAAPFDIFCLVQDYGRWLATYIDAIYVDGACYARVDGRALEPTPLLMEMFSHKDVSIDAAE